MASVNILVRGTNWVGDAVMSVPALRRLRTTFPDARITLHTRSWAEGIFRDADFIDDILTFDKSRSKVSDALAQAKVLKQHKFDLAVVFPNSFETALVTKLAGIPRRIGYAKEGRGFLLTDAIPIPDWKNERHEVFYYLNLVGRLGAESVADDDVDIDLKVSEQRREAARTFLAANGADAARKTIALGVGSTNSRAKRWPAENYARLGDLIQKELGANVVIVGAQDEIEVAREVVGKSEIKPIVLTGKTNLADAVAILAEVDALVSNDMGLAHIAPATGTPTLVVFGPTNDKTTRPIGSEIIRRDLDCSPCMLRDCPIDHRCMTMIGPEEVFDRLTRLIAS